MKEEKEAEAKKAAYEKEVAEKKAAAEKEAAEKAAAEKAAKEKAEKKEKKHVDIRGALDSLKGTIGSFKDNKDKINKSVENKGKSFQNEKVKTDITGVKETLDKYHKLKDETVKAVAEEGQVLQKEFNAKTKVALHGVKDVVSIPVAPMKHFDFVKDHKEDKER